MKKALALVLALVLALSLGVSAFALDLVELNPVTTSGSSKDTLEDLEVFGYDLVNTYRAPAEGGEFYFELSAKDANGDVKPLKNIEVTSTGIVSAEIVKYNPDEADNKNSSGWHVTKSGAEFSLDDAKAKLGEDAYNKLANDSKYFTTHKGYDLVDKDGKVVTSVTGNSYQTIVDSLKETNPATGKKYTLQEIFDYWTNESVEGHWTGIDGAVAIKETFQLTSDSYEFCKAVADALNKADKTSRYSVSNGAQNYMVKLTVAPNYTAAYKNGTFKVTATRIDAVDEKGRVTASEKVTFEGKVISDVTIFEYEMVKWAGKEDEVLYTSDDGYSDYLTTLAGYDKGSYNYDEDLLREYPNATVISTTAFRQLRENKYGIKVNAKDLLVKIPEVVSGQKGVNFAAYGVTLLNAKGAVTTKDDVKKVVFGFYGDQVIASDFSIEVDLGMDAYELRERFGEKVEEEDIITYYIVKDGKVIDKFTVDYMKDDIDEDLVLEIKNKAGSTLGEYELVIEAPSSDNKGEENPNTGAESVIGVVAAMAVVSVAAAAAVSLKK